MFDFDAPVERRGTHCSKWDGLAGQFGADPEDALPMWVADMDFPAPPAVQEALAREIANQVYGYFGDKRPYLDAITGWMARRHGWQVDPDWVLTTHGLVSAIGLALQAYSEPGDGVIICTPVYHAFARMIEANGREVVEAVMARDGLRYSMDLDRLAGQLTGRERMLILCSPHNPCGRVWGADELRAVAAFCEAHDLLLIADEIHHDLVFPGHTHHVLANMMPELAHRLITLSAASKTFNLAGGMTGNAIIADPALRAKMAARLAATGASPNRFGMVMTTAAYSAGDDWLDALIGYLDGNRRIFDAGMDAIPGVRSIPLEATYLAWVDFTATGMDPDEIRRRCEAGARVFANRGPSFGTGGAGFMRFNLATPRARIEAAVTRLQEAFADLQ